MAQSVEGLTLQESSAVIVEHLQDPSAVARQLHAAFKLTAGELEEVMETNGRRGKADKIMRVVQRRVSFKTSTAPAEYRAFVDILREEPANDLLLETLEESYVKHAQRSVQAADVAAPFSICGKDPLADILNKCPTNKDLTSSFKYLDDRGIEQRLRMWTELEEVGGSWQRIAQELGYGAQVKTIEIRNHRDPHLCYSEVITLWFRNGKDVTWGGFINALDGCGYNNLVLKLRFALARISRN